MRYNEFKPAVKEQETKHYSVFVLDPRPEFRNKNVIVLTNVPSEEAFKKWWSMDPRLHVLFKNSSGEPVLPLVDIGTKKFQPLNLTLGQYASMVVRELTKQFGTSSLSTGTNIKPPRTNDPIKYNGNTYTFSTSDRKQSH